MNTDEIIVQLPTHELHDSPFNPRKRFTGIAELADTMRPPNGRVLQALLVRPRIPPLFAGDADLAASAVTGFEVVFGHRRRLAGIEAGLATLPCTVRAMTDAEARHCQVVENLQREDVHPIEEAEGFEALMRDDGLTADEVAQQLGKSRSYVYGRLKLLQACPQVRSACLDGNIGSEVALLVARLRTPKLQEKALAAIAADTNSAANMEDGGKRSYRHIRDLLADKFTLDLKTAIFDTDDATLCVAAGPCGACPKRTGNAPEFEDLASKTREGEHRSYFRQGGPDICTDPDCFAAKKAAHLQRKAAEAAQAGATVISGNKAKAAIGADGRLKGYVALKDAQAALKHAPKGGAMPQVVTIIDQRTGKAVKAVKATDAPAAAGPKAQRGHGRDWEAERKEREAAAKAETERRAALHAPMRERMLTAEPSTDELRMVLWLSVQSLDWGVERRALARHGVAAVEGGHDRNSFAWIDKLPPDTLRVVLMDLLLDQACEVSGHDEDENLPLFNRLASIYGISTDRPPTPSTAGASAEITAAAKTPLRGALYQCPDTAQTWSGKGLKPKWVQVALARGVALQDLLASKPDATSKTAAKAAIQSDEAGFAGKQRTAGTDLFADALPA